MFVSATEPVLYINPLTTQYIDCGGFLDDVGFGPEAVLGMHYTETPNCDQIRHNLDVAFISISKSTPGKRCGVGISGVPELGASLSESPNCKTLAKERPAVNKGKQKG
jgi:hypothetical protein